MGLGELEALAVHVGRSGDRRATPAAYLDESDPRDLSKNEFPVREGGSPIFAARESGPFPTSWRATSKAGGLPAGLPSPFDEPARLDTEPAVGSDVLGKASGAATEPPAGEVPAELPLWSSAGASPAPAAGRPLPSGAGTSALPAAAEPAVAEPELQLSVDQILQFTVENHPRLRARQHEVAMAEARLITAGLLPNPRLVLDSDTPVNEGEGSQLSGRLTYEIPTAGKRRKREAVAQAGIARARYALTREAETVLLDAADAALEVLYYQELAELQARLSQLAEQRAQLERSRFEAQAATFADKTEADADAAQAELQRRDTLARLDVARAGLARAAAFCPPRMIRVEGQLAFEPLPELPVETVLAAAESARPEIFEARAALAESQREYALAQADAFPDLTIGPRYSDRLGTGNDDVGARIDFDVPIFDRNQGGICESAARTWVSRSELDDAELDTLGDVAAAYVELVSLQSRLAYYQSRVLPLAEQTEQMLLRQGAAQAISANQVSDLLRSFIRMHVDYLDLRYRYNRLRTRLEIFLDQRLDDLAAAACMAGDGLPYGDGSSSANAAASPERLPAVDQPSDYPIESMPPPPPVEYPDTDALFR
jgi:cobalt-zinc-cadmium efflux system outer membrane protein